MVVDLAGSENFTDHHDKSLRDEGREVNKSLQALEKVLNDLAESSKTGLNRFIDYRTSKLTEALRGRLGGNNISRILICINPDVGSGPMADQNVKAMKDAIRFGQISEKVSVNAQQNITMTMAEKEQFEERVKSLQKELAARDAQVEELQAELEAARKQREAAKEHRRQHQQQPLQCSFRRPPPGPRRWLLRRAEQPLHQRIWQVQPWPHVPWWQRRVSIGRSCGCRRRW